MTIQAVLGDIIKQCALNKVDILKITGGETTKVQSFDEDKTLFIEGNLEAVPEFVGEFGVSNLKLLSGLLGFTNYKLGEAAFKVHTREVDGVQVPDQFEFRGGGSKSVFKLMNILHVPSQATIANIPWEVSLTEVNKAKLAEFKQFASLYGEIDKQFSVRTVDNDLVFFLGDDKSSSHSGSMVFQEDVSGTIANELVFPVDKFMMLMNLAEKADSYKLMFTSKGLLGIVTETPFGNYKYYLRQSIRG